jgi:hypothetical protein
MIVVITNGMMSFQISIKNALCYLFRDSTQIETITPSGLADKYFEVVRRRIHNTSFFVNYKWAWVLRYTRLESIAGTNTLAH